MLVKSVDGTKLKGSSNASEVRLRFKIICQLEELGPNKQKGLIRKTQEFFIQNKWLACSVCEEDLRVLVDHKLNMSQWCDVNPHILVWSDFSWNTVFGSEQ